jgi:hypothetical protein
MAEIVEFLPVILPTGIALLSVYLSIKLSKGEPHKVWWRITAALCVAASALTWVSQSHASKAHKREIDQQTQAMDTLKAKFDEAEIKHAAEMNYMEEELNAFGQVDPAVLKLAQVSEENIHRQYEAKVLSNSQLRDLTTNVVKGMRDLSYKHKQLSDQQLAKNWALRVQIRKDGNNPQKMTQLRHQEMQELLKEHARFEYEFKNNILGDAICARDELLRRIANPPQASFDISGSYGRGGVVFQGFLAGADPIGEAADYLERLAMELSP